jgi:hypothetical protein
MHVKNSNPLSHEYGYGSMGLKRIDLMNNKHRKRLRKIHKVGRLMWQVFAKKSFPIC